MSINRACKPPPLLVPANSTLNAYLINTNGLNPTRVQPLSEGTDPVKLNKIKMLRDIANRNKLDVIFITETHDKNPMSVGPLMWGFCREFL